MKNNCNNTAFCFDLDGTITQEEILPIIAKNTNFSEEIEALTLATLSGILHFRQSFLLRCQLLKELPVSLVQEVVKRVKLFNTLINFIKLNKNRCFIITGNLDCWIEPLVKRIGCTTFSSTAIVENNYITRIDNVLDKGHTIKYLRETTNFNKFVVVGDSFSDVGMFDYADISIAVGYLHMPVKALIDQANMLILSEDSLCKELNMLL